MKEGLDVNILIFEKEILHIICISQQPSIHITCLTI